jgi:integrase
MSRLQEFLSDYQNRSTRTGYNSSLRSFIDFVYGPQRKGIRVSPEEIETYDRLIDQYFEDNRDYQTDVKEFLKSISDRPPLSVRQAFNCVREFLSVNGLELDKKELRRIKKHVIPKGGVRTVERDMDIETVRSIMMHLDVKGKSMVLCLASGGMRINELLQVTLDDIDLDSKPAKITIRGTSAKNGNDRFTFVSAEAVQAIREWLKVRDQYLALSVKRNKGFARNGRSKAKTPDDNRLYPFSDNIAITMWEHALKKSGYDSTDKTTGRSQIHLHMLRKFFISQLSLIVSKEIPEALAGHAGYLTGAYRRYTAAQLAEQYLKAEHLVTIAMPKEIHELQTEFRTRMQDQGVILERVVAENAELKSLILEQGDAFRQLRAEKEELKQSLDQWSDLSLSFARIINVIGNNPEAALTLRDGISQWRKEILDGKYGPVQRDHLIRLIDAKQNTE